MISPGTTLKNGAIVLDSAERSAGIFVCLCFWASNRESFVVWSSVSSEDLCADGGYYFATLAAAYRQFQDLTLIYTFDGASDENRAHRVPRGWDKV